MPFPYCPLAQNTHPQPPPNSLFPFINIIRRVEKNKTATNLCPQFRDVCPEHFPGIFSSSCDFCNLVIYSPCPRASNAIGHLKIPSIYHSIYLSSIHHPRQLIVKRPQFIHSTSTNKEKCDGSHPETKRMPVLPEARNHS